MEQSNFESYSDGISIATRIASKLEELQTAIESFGVRIECRTDFKLFRQSAMKITDLGDITGVFDDRVCSIDADNGFWIQATDKTGNVIHRQAFRHDDLTGTTLARHWLCDPAIYAPAGYDIAIEKSDFNIAPAANNITGSVCYHGEFWLDLPYRKTELPPFLSKFGILYALNQFSPDFVYGLVPPKLIEQGWAARQGYLHMHPWAPRWRIRGKAKYYDEYLVWISGKELLGLWTTSKRDIDVLSRINVRDYQGRAAAELIAGY
jgi:hypothetical protein